MEFFNKAKAVRLKSHLDKYLVADDDEESVRQSRNGSSRKARWTVEFVEGNSHVIRLKSCHGKYLTASDEAFLLGMTGKKVLQTIPLTKKDTCIEWEPIKDGYQVRLRTRAGKFLRANGATLPWRNSVTHDLPNRTATQNWILWEVDVVDISQFESSEYIQSYASSFSSLPDDGDSTISNTLSLQSTSESFSNRTRSMVSQRSVGNKSISERQGVRGMQLFDKAKVVRLQSHLGKYLVADDDEETVRQSRNGSSQRARWTVEFVQGKSNVICLKSCHGRYLTATNEAFLLGMTGKKVLQTHPSNKMDPCIEWEPIKEGLHIKLRTKEGKYLRANGATLPWRNSITHDIPHRTATQNWVLWAVDIVDIATTNTVSAASSVLSPASSFNSLADDYSPSPDAESPLNYGSSAKKSLKLISGMEFFKNASSVRLKSHHDKYLIADSDQETVIQERDGTSETAKWTVELVGGFKDVIRLKSCHGKYLTATDEQFLLGVTGRRVQQTLPRKLDSSVEWEPIRDGFQVRLKTRYGNYLRANGGLPPWRNSITHDIPHRHTDWILWQVEVSETRQESPENIPRSGSLEEEEEEEEEEDLSSSSFNLRTPGFSPQMSSDSVYDSPKKSEGRLVYYRIIGEDGDVDDAAEELSFQFKGPGLEELTQKLEEETGLENIIVCSRNKFNGQLFPMRLALPPNNATMHIVVVPSTSEVAGEFLGDTPRS